MEILRIAGLLIILTLIATAFIPVVAAQSPDKGDVQVTDGSPRLIAPDANITLVSDYGNTSIYRATFRLSENEARYYHVEKRREVTADGEENGVIVMQNQDACGCDRWGFFGNESGYTKTSGGISVHIGPDDMSELYYGEDGQRKFATWFAVATGLTAGEASLWGEEMLPTTWPGYYTKTQKDYSLDFSMSDKAVHSIHVAITKPYCEWISIDFKNFQTSFCL